MFPLYDSFTERKKALSKEERRILHEMLQGLDEDGQLYAAAIIFTYQQQCGLSKPLRIAATFTFNVNELPTELQGKLTEFCHLHLKVMKEKITM